MLFIDLENLFVGVEIDKTANIGLINRLWAEDVIIDRMELP